MQDNLRLNGGRTLTPADSNVTSNVTLPNNITSSTSVNTAMQIITGSNGNFYNWCAAIAIGNCSNLNTNQSTSICPKNWYLPDSGSISSNKSWANLTRAYEVTTGPELVNVPVLNFKYTGGWYNGSVNYQGSEGFYWSSTGVSDNSYWAYILIYRASGTLSTYSKQDKIIGQSIRCVFSAT